MLAPPKLVEHSPSVGSTPLCGRDPGGLAGGLILVRPLSVGHATVDFVRLGRYRDVLALPDVRSVLLLGFFVRMPMFAAALVLTVHIVGALGRGYAEAGLAAAALTVSIAVSAPWRGRLLDRMGLRRTVLPSVLVQLGVWAVAPFAPYELLLPLCVVSGLFAVPVFSILRQGLLAAVPPEGRRTALSLDSVFTELSFMAGPGLGAWAAVVWDTRWVLLAAQLASVSAAVGLLVVDPPMRSAAGSRRQEREPRVAPPTEPSADGYARGAGWVSADAVAVLAAAAAALVVLAGTEVGVIAALRSTDNQGAIGWVLALWGAGSLLGGLAYGAWHRSLPVFWLLGGLAVGTLPVALAGSLPSLSVLLFLCGVLCAPTITATVDGLSRLVPERSRGEAMGWHGSAMMGGQALGAPLAGVAIDRGGWQWGFVTVALVGLAVAVAGGLRRSRSSAQLSMADAPS